MLVEACNWSGDQRVVLDDVGERPQLAHYVAGWPRPGDFGRIAVDDSSAPLGAAWARRFPAVGPGFGFVAEDVPEISMAVVASWRGRGLGRRLLDALIADARTAGCRALSLSVEDGNHAKQLYRAAGFVIVGRVDTSDTMLLELNG